MLLCKWGLVQVAVEVPRGPEEIMKIKHITYKMTDNSNTLEINPLQQNNTDISIHLQYKY